MRQPNGVSVCIPLFNYDYTVAEAIESAAIALEQIDYEGEIVVVDDCSTDNSYAMAAIALKRCDVPFQLLQNECNSGVAHSRNRAVDAAKHPWVFTLDADNTIKPHGLRILLAECKRQDSVAGYGLLERIDDQGNNIGLLSCAEINLEYLQQGNYVDAMALFRRDLLTRFRYDESLKDIAQGWEDYDLWIRLAEAGESIAFVPQVVATYRHHSGSMIGGIRQTEADALFEVILCKRKTLAPAIEKKSVHIPAGADDGALLDALPGIVERALTVTLDPAYAQSPSVLFLAQQLGVNIQERPVDSTELAIAPAMASPVSVAEVAHRIWARSTLKPCPVTISIITPVFNAPPQWLSTCIQSVTTQLYPFFEWVVVDDYSDSPETLEQLTAIAQLDHRVVLHSLPKNKGVSIATDIAINMAQGEFLLFLDHDDFLADDALLRVAAALATDTTIDAIVSSHISVNGVGEEIARVIKTDWDWDWREVVIRNHSTHLRGFAKHLFGTVGPHDSSLNGCQDTDWLLRAKKMSAIKNPLVLPECLYHWRQVGEGMSTKRGNMHVVEKMKAKHGLG